MVEESKRVMGKPVLDTRSSETSACAAQLTLQNKPLWQQECSQVGTI